MNIASYKLLEDCLGLIETMIHRGIVSTYKALERNSNRIVVIKVIKKSKGNAAKHSTLKRLKELNSPYLVKYIECYEDEKEYRVCDPVVCDRLDCNGEL